MITLSSPAAPAPAAPPSLFDGPDGDDGITLTELSDEPGDRWVHSGLLDAYATRGFEAGRRRGFRDAAAAVGLAAEDLTADRGLGDVPPSVVRQVAAALTARLAAHAPPAQPGERTVEGGLGI